MMFSAQQAKQGSIENIQLGDELGFSEPIFECVQYTYVCEMVDSLFNCLQVSEQLQ